MSHEDARAIALVRSSRAARAPWVRAAAGSVSKLGYRPQPVETIAEITDQPGLIVHLFPASFEDILGSMEQLPAAATLIVDIPHLPFGLARLPDTERAQIELSQLRDLAAAALVTRSQSAAELCASHGIASQLVAADCSLQASAADIAAAGLEFGIAPAMRVLACICDLEQDSGLDQALETAGLLLADDRIDQLVVIGEGDNGARIARHAAALGLGDRVSFIGMAAPQRWPALLAGFDAILFPGTNAAVLGSDIPQLMAVASQLPVRIAGTRAAWRSQPGLVPESAQLQGSAASWRAQLGSLLDQQPEISCISADPDQLAEIYRTLAPAG